MSLVSVSDYARQSGLTKQAVSKSLDRLAGLGLVVTERRNGRRYFDSAVFEAARARVADPARMLVGQARSVPLPASVSASPPSMPSSLFDGFDPACMAAPPSASREEAGDATHLEQYNRGRAASIALDVHAKAMRMAVEAGQLVLAEEVEREIVRALGDLRDTLLSRPADLASRLVGLGEREMTVALRDIFRSLLDQLSQRFTKEETALHDTDPAAEGGVEETG